MAKRLTKKMRQDIVLDILARDVWRDELQFVLSEIPVQVLRDMESRGFLSRHGNKVPFWMMTEAGEKRHRSTLRS